jgi:hypothetical protein
MKIKTVYQTSNTTNKKAIGPMDQPLIEKPGKDKKTHWVVWEYKQEKKTNYDNHVLYRKITYSAQNLYTKQSKELAGHMDDQPHRWKIYKRVKKIQKPLAR